MDNKDLYRTIFMRKSIRKYKDEPLDNSKLNEILNYINGLIPLDKNIKTEIVILSEKEIKTLQPIKAPHYVVIYSENKEGYLPNAGFLLQQVDLFLSANGIGSCWLGMGSPQKAYAKHNGLDYVITMAFGIADESLHRQDISEFNRKSMSEITSIKGEDVLFEAVRLSPSATNSQPWYFSGNRDNIIVYRKLSNFLKAAFYDKFNKIDMGIALCHLRISALNLGKDIKFIKETTTAPKGYEYIITAHII